MRFPSGQVGLCVLPSVMLIPPPPSVAGELNMWAQAMTKTKSKSGQLNMWPWPWPRPSPPRSPGPASQPGGSLRKLCSPKKKKIGADDVGAPVQNRLSRASHRRLISLANLYLSQHKQKYTWKEEGNTGKCKHGRKQSTKVQGQNRPAQPKAGWINRTVWGNLLI